MIKAKLYYSQPASEAAAATAVAALEVGSQI